MRNSLLMRKDILEVKKERKRFLEQMGNLQGILTQEERQDDDWHGNTVLGQWALQSKQTLRQQSWNQDSISTQLGSHFPNSNGV